MSDNWVVQNLENALEVWNGKLSEIWQLITQSPQTFKGGSIWSVIVNIHGALQAIGYALLVLFFVVGVVKTCGSFTDLKKPEHAVKVFVRFAIAKGLITYGMELMMAILEIIQGVVSTIMRSAGFGTPQATVLPQEIVTAIEDCGFFESIPLWAVTLIGGLFIWVLSFVMILSVYGRFFKMYMYTAIAPIPLSSFAGEPTQNIGKSFLKSYASVCLEGAIIVLACIIFSVFASSPPVVNPDAAAASMVWTPFRLSTRSRKCALPGSSQPYTRSIHAWSMAMGSVETRMPMSAMQGSSAISQQSQSTLMFFMTLMKIILPWK